VTGYITFHMDGRDLACRLDEVKEVVRAVGIDPLPGTRAPVTGVLELRNEPLPVVDLRADAYPEQEGDVLVLNAVEGHSYGIAVDRVVAVLDEGELPDPGGVRPEGLPPYVIGILRRPDDPSPVLLVALRVLAGLDAAQPEAQT
jgi:chemotaxis signal transduction protein